MTFPTYGKLKFIQTTNQPFLYSMDTSTWFAHQGEVYPLVPSPSRRCFLLGNMLEPKFPKPNSFQIKCITWNFNEKPLFTWKTVYYRNFHIWTSQHPPPPPPKPNPRMQRSACGRRSGSLRRTSRNPSVAPLRWRRKEAGRGRSGHHFLNARPIERFALEKPWIFPSENNNFTKKWRMSWDL